MQCNQCGKCCEAVYLSYSPKQLVARARGGQMDADFVLRFWKPVSLKEATQNDAGYVQRLMRKDRDLLEKGRFYLCRKLNQRTKLCRVQNHKPKVCSDFPFYGKDPNPNRIMKSGCGFST